MPAVTVLPVMSATTTTAAYPNRDTLILDSMPSPTEGPGVDSVPSPHHTKENADTTTDGAGGKAGQEDTPEQTKGGSDLDKSGGDSIRKDDGSSGVVGNVSPSQSINSYPHALPAHLTPQQPGYYV